MKVLAVIGCQWGDEGKAKVIDYILRNGYVDEDGNDYRDTHIVARYQGGANAGHTIVTPENKKVVSHLVPSGVIKPGIYNLLLPGVVVDPGLLVKEIDDWRKAGYPITRDNFGVDGRAGVTLKFHVERDLEKERKAGKKGIGTTGKGIGPTYVDRVERTGINFAEFVDSQSFRQALEWNVERSGTEIDVEDYVRTYATARERLGRFLVDFSEVLDRNSSARVILEGAQGVMLDNEIGSYPFVTGSSPVRLPLDASHRVGIVKAYTTRVGEGPFPTELGDPELIRGDKPDQKLTEEDVRMAFDGDELLMGRFLRLKGDEFGATTGRPRRTGWFDVPLVKYATVVGGIDSVALTKLDVLSGIPKIKVCTGYQLHGAPTGIPMNRFGWYDLEPVYTEVDGWEGDIRSARIFRDLPGQAQEYVKFVEDLIGREIRLISIGPKAEETIVMD